MAQGQSKGRVTQAFNDQIYYLKLQNEKCAKASADYGIGRAWMIGPSGYNGWDGDTTDLTGMKKAFDRSEITDAFNEIMDADNPGTGADRMAMKFQSDYLAAMDRAFRTRHAGLIRCEMFSADRRQLQVDGNLENSTTTYAQKLIARGQG